MSEQGVSNGGQRVIAARENSISIPNTSVISKMFKLSIRLETCLVLLITICEIVSCAIVLSLAKTEKPNTPLKPWIVGYLSVCAAFLAVIYLDYRVKKGIFDSIVLPTRSEEEFDSFDKFYFLALPTQCLKWVFECFFFVWFIIGCVWATKGSSSRSEAPLLFWLCISLLIYRGLGYALLIASFVFQCCCLPCINVCMTCFPRSEVQHDSA